MIEVWFRRETLAMRNSIVASTFIVTGGSDMKRSFAGRERAAEYLAERLFFELEKRGDLYSLCRKIGGFTPQHNLTLTEVEKLLELWKLQGPHGG
jgi:hypothetical protein